MKYAFTLTPAQQTLVEQNMKLIKRTISSSIGTNEGVCGLIAVGNGETDFDAPYDLVSSLYVTPISESIPLRLVTFLKMILLDRVPVSQAWKLFQQDRPNQREAQVMALSKQALLSTAELIKCMEVGARDLSTDQKVLAALYNDDTTTCDNIGWEMQGAENQKAVTLAVANLYLRKQIIFQRL